MEDFSHITEELEIIEKNLTFKFNTERCVTTDVNKIPKAKDFELFKVRRCYHFNKNTPDHIILTIPKPEYLVLANKNQLQKESGRIISIQGTSVVEHNSKILQVSTNTSTKLNIDDIEVKIEKCSIKEPNTEIPFVVKNEIPSIPTEDCIVATNQNILVSNDTSSATEANLCVHNDNLAQIINTPKNYTSFSPVLNDNAKHENTPPKMNGEKFSQPLSENISTLCEELEVTLRNTDSELSDDEELKPDISELITYNKLTQEVEETELGEREFCEEEQIDTKEGIDNKRTQKEVEETELGEREFCEEEQIDTKEGIDIKFHNYDESNGLLDKIYEYFDLEDGFRGFSSDEIERFSEKSIKVENLLEDMEESIRCSNKSPYAEINVHSNLFNEVINKEVSPESNSKTYESVILEVTLHSTEASDAEIDYTDPNSKEASDVEMEEQFEAIKTSNTEIHKIITAVNSKNGEIMDECGSLIIAQQCAEDKINEACNKSLTELKTSIGEEPIQEKSENSVLAQETRTTEENRNTIKEMCVVEQEFSIIGEKIPEKPENSAVIQQTAMSKENGDQINENIENSVITKKPPILKENGEQIKERPIVEQEFSIVDGTIIENLHKNSILKGKAPISKEMETCENPIQKNSQVEDKMDKNINKENTKNDVQETNRHNGQKHHNGIEEKLFEKFIQENYQMWGKIDETSIPENHKVVENADGHGTKETPSEPSKTVIEKNRQVLKKIFTQVNSKNMKLEEQTLGTGEKPSQPSKIVIEENSRLGEELDENFTPENHEIVKNTEDNIKEFYRQVVSLAKLSEAIIQENFQAVKQVDAISMTENLDVIKNMKNSIQKDNQLEIEQGKAATREENPSEPFKTIVQVEEKIDDIFLPVSHEIVVENTENKLEESIELEEVQEQVSEAKEDPLEKLLKAVFQENDQIEEKMDEISKPESLNLVENNTQKIKLQKRVNGIQKKPPESSKYEMDRKIDEISVPEKLDVMVNAEEKRSESAESIIQVKEQMDEISTPANLNFVENSENHVELKEEPIATEGKPSESPETICQDNHQVKELLDKISMPENPNVMENSENDMKLEEESSDGQEKAIVTEEKPETVNLEKVHKISEVSGKPLVVEEPHRQEEFDQEMQEIPLTRKATKDKNEVQIHKSTEETNDNKKRPTNIDEEMLQVAEILGSLSENIINNEIKNLQTETLGSGIHEPVMQDMEMQDVSFKIPSKKDSHPSVENHDESSNDSIISEARLDIKDLDTTFHFEQTHTLVSSKDDNKNQKTPQKMCKKMFKCDHCDFKVQRECHLKVHLRVHILPYWCSICSEMYSDTIGLQSHVRTIHHFNGRQTLKANGEKLSQTGKKPFKCGFCNYMTSYITRLQNHTLVHKKEKLHECDKCGYNTLTEWSMERHMSEHSNEQKLFECEECGYITMYRHRLDVHQEIHSGKKLYKCDICPFSTAHIGYFNAHKGFHATMIPKKESVSDDESNTPHKCDECDYSTAKHWELLKHASAFGHQVPSTIIVPPLVRQLKCSSCNYLAKSYKELKTHITSHTKIKPCKCKLIASSHYEVIFHNVVKFMCSVCSAVHLTHQELEKHIKKKCRNHHLFKYEHNV